ncbi:MAG: AAA family ATPase, partial [Lachnospiraceae bacterium]|nr:AAA family ATPase [Lachnospiraceae bacterium]
MGVYFNPSNASFKKDRNYEIYVDKTELIGYLNKLVGTPRNCLAVSHARRFGKSHAAGMIDAYYSLGCDSSELFDNTKIAASEDYRKYMNKYNVIHLDISSVWDFHKEDLIESIQERVCDDFKEEYGDGLNYSKDLYLLIQEIYRKTNIPFVIIIDEWDCVIRNSEDKELVHRYLQFLHSLFKSEESKAFLALAYITGILPIKRIKDESALNNFREYTMLKSKPITKYYGFTEDEVRTLCKEYDMDFETTKVWYNGYLIDGIHMYNPNSVVQAMIDQECDSYWRNTSSFSSINTFITMNYAGLKDDIMTMMAGGKVRVNTNTFKNDFSTIASKDDALTALIHLGYLGYDVDRKKAFIPNYEVATAFEAALQTGEWTEIAKAISICDELLDETIEGNAERVAELIEFAHETYTSVLKYNDENSLSCVLTMAYFTAPGYYNIIREMPAGKG